MTSISIADCETTSPCGRYTLEACSPHNGSVQRPDGRPASHEFPYIYREHQRDFRYRLLEHGRVRWERWQQQGEDSPRELIVSDDGWSVIRTHGFQPELIVVSPDGRDAVRVRVGEAATSNKNQTTDVPTFDWTPEQMVVSTAGLYWAEHSWRYFVMLDGSPHFVWRTSWGQRLVIDLGRAALVVDSVVGRALDEEESRGVVSLLSELSHRRREVANLLTSKQEDDRTGQLVEQVRQVSAALHLTGIHRVRVCIPFLREWEAIDYVGSLTGSDVLLKFPLLEKQFFRPVAQHSLRLLGQEPAGMPAYNFVNSFGDDRIRFPLPRRPADRRKCVSQIRKRMGGEEVLALLGGPDFVRHWCPDSSGPPYRWAEAWEYDFLLCQGWVTVRITWEETDHGTCMTGLEKVTPYWLTSDDRIDEIFRF